MTTKSNKVRKDEKIHHLKFFYFRCHGNGGHLENKQYFLKPKGFFVCTPIVLKFCIYTGKLKTKIHTVAFYKILKNNLFYDFLKSLTLKFSFFCYITPHKSKNNQDITNRFCMIFCFTTNSTHTKFLEKILKNN